MIICEEPLRKNTVDSQKKLVQYLEHGRDGLRREDRVEFAFTRNCTSQDPREAEAEMTAVAACNTRSKAQKFMHIVISPAPGERLERKDWEHVAEKLAAALGLSNHQYACYVHKDTDLPHMHMTINLINPADFTRANLSFSKRKEMAVAAELEKELRLKEIDHAPKMDASERLARNAERKSGQESLLTYLKGFSDELLAAKSWEEFHMAAARHGIRAEALPGRGIRFCAAQEGGEVYAKASAVDRKLSLHALEERLGPWQAAGGEARRKQAEPDERYSARPIDYGTSDRQRLAELFEEFKDSQDQRKQARRTLLDAEQKLRDEEIARALSQFRQAAAAARTARDFRALEELRRWKDARIKQIKEAHRKKNKEIRRRTQTMTFQDYLKSLRDPADADPARDILSSRPGAWIAPERNGAEGIRIVEEVTITRISWDFGLIKRTGKGQDIFASAMSRGDLIRDYGKRITCNDKPSLLTVASLLDLAKRRYGDEAPIRIFGTLEFQKQAAMMAAQMGISIKCDSAEAQKQFNNLMEDAYARNEREKRIKELAAGGLAGIELGDARLADLGTFRGTATFATVRRFAYGRAGSAFGSGRTGKPGAGRPGQSGRSAPAGSKGGVPPVQGGDLDENRRRGGVLLHDHALENMGEHGLDELHGTMRREVPGREDGRGSRAEEAGGLSPLEAYAAERNAKRKAGVPGIPEHAVWNGEQGEFTFRGFRMLGGESCLLLEKNGILYIKLCSIYEKKRLHKAGRGSAVRVSASGRASLASNARSNGGGRSGR